MVKVHKDNLTAILSTASIKSPFPFPVKLEAKDGRLRLTAEEGSLNLLAEVPCEGNGISAVLPSWEIAEVARVLKKLKSGIITIKNGKSTLSLSWEKGGCEVPIIDGDVVKEPENPEGLVDVPAEVLNIVYEQNATFEQPPGLSLETHEEKLYALSTNNYSLIVKNLGESKKEIKTYIPLTVAKIIGSVKTPVISVGDGMVVAEGETVKVVIKHGMPEKWLGVKQLKSLKEKLEKTSPLVKLSLSREDLLEAVKIVPGKDVRLSLGTSVTVSSFESDSLNVRESVEVDPKGVEGAGEGIFSAKDLEKILSCLSSPVLNVTLYDGIAELKGEKEAGYITFTKTE